VQPQFRSESGKTSTRFLVTQSRLFTVGLPQPVALFSPPVAAGDDQQDRGDERREKLIELRETIFVFRENLPAVLAS